jgi:riboflavin kinase
LSDFKPRHVLHAGVVQVLPSLLAFDPAVYGLPPFGDLVEGVIPLDPVFTISGKVVKGFGRGSKVRRGSFA